MNFRNSSQPGASANPKHLYFAVLAILFGLFTCIGFLELAARAYYSEWTLENYAAAEKDLLKSSWPAKFDPILGWSLRPGAETRRDFSPNPAHVDALGMRENGQPRPEGPGILALGDSMTFGAEVGADNQSWPAILELALDRPTYNGGVYGYGIDQAVLKLETLEGKLPPSVKVAVLSFIADDIHRGEKSLFFGATKPYFSVESGKLKLHTEHLAPPTRSVQGLDPARVVLGHSFFLHKLLRRTFPGWWLQGSLPWKQEHDQGEEVACLLMGRFAEKASKLGLKALVVAEYVRQVSEEERRLCAMVLGCARAQGLPVLDLGPRLSALKAADPKAFDLLYIAHMTEAGNRLVANEIAKALRAEPGLRRALKLSTEK